LLLAPWIPSGPASIKTALAGRASASASLGSGATSRLAMDAVEQGLGELLSVLVSRFDARISRGPVNGAVNASFLASSLFSSSMMLRICVFTCRKVLLGNHL